MATEKSREPGISQDESQELVVELQKTHRSLQTALELWQVSD